MPKWSVGTDSWAWHISEFTQWFCFCHESLPYFSGFLPTVDMEPVDKSVHCCSKIEKKDLYLFACCIFFSSICTQPTRESEQQQTPQPRSRATSQLGGWLLEPQFLPEKNIQSGGIIMLQLSVYVSKPVCAHSGPIVCSTVSHHDSWFFNR